MALGGNDVSPYRKFVIPFSRETVSAGETDYLIGGATAGLPVGAAFRVAGIEVVAQNQSTGGGSSTITVWKDTTASGAAIYSMDLGTGTGEIAGEDYSPAAAGAEEFDADEGLIVRIVSVTNVIDGLSGFLLCEWAGEGV